MYCTIRPRKIFGHSCIAQSIITSIRLGTCAHTFVHNMYVCMYVCVTTVDVYFQLAFWLYIRRLTAKRPFQFISLCHRELLRRRITFASVLVANSFGLHYVLPAAIVMCIPREKWRLIDTTGSYVCFALTVVFSLLERDHSSEPDEEGEGRKGQNPLQNFDFHHY